MTQKRRFLAGYKREAASMLDAPGIRMSQIAGELGIGAAMLERWRQEMHQESASGFSGNGRPRDGELTV